MSTFSFPTPKHFAFIAIIISIFLSQAAMSQELEGSVWRVTDASKPYPKGNYWDFWFLSDSTYVIQDRYSKNFKIQIGIKRIELPGYEGTFPFELKNDELHIRSENKKWIAKSLNSWELQTHSMFREKVLNLNPPSYHNDGSFILAIDYIYSYPAIPIYFSPFIKNTNGKFGVPSSLHLEVGLSSGVFPLSEQLNAVRNAPISDLLRKNIHNQDSHGYYYLVNNSPILKTSI